MSRKIWLASSENCGLEASGITGSRPEKQRTRRVRLNAWLGLALPLGNICRNCLNEIEKHLGKVYAGFDFLIVHGQFSLIEGCADVEGALSKRCHRSHCHLGQMAVQVIELLCVRKRDDSRLEKI